jgi:hypothetical protein
MIKNVGMIDRVLRVAIALGIGYGYASGTLAGTPLILASIVGVIFLATGLSAFCPLYRVLGLSTCPR